ncbi:MAG: SH3 domain-containing protein [Caldilineaceae bacterium]|nr:SH3 domain-containing protein [Caldilineaceae bacterium]
MTQLPSTPPPQRPRPPAQPNQLARPQTAEYVPATVPPPAPERRPVTRASAGRRLFWIGFLTSFLLLSLVSCGGLVLSTGLNRIDLASLQGGEPAWRPPQVTPTATPDATVSGATASQSSSGLFAIGQPVRNMTNSRVNIRQTPGHLGKSDSDILAQMQPGETVTILDGPLSADNLVWWHIRYTGSGGRTIEGWTAEATGSGVQILGQ